jgi:guanylate kinase
VTRAGIPFVVSAPSGTGKTTVCRRVVAEDGGVEFSISHTTRAMRAGEVHGRDYFFTPRPEFERLIAAGEFVEWAEYAGNLYGTSFGSLDAPLGQGRDLLLEVEVEGARQLRARRRDARFIFLLPPSRAELERRLRGRGTESRAASPQSTTSCAPSASSTTPSSTTTSTAPSTPCTRSSPPSAPATPRT